MALQEPSQPALDGKFHLLSPLFFTASLMGYSKWALDQFSRFNPLDYYLEYRKYKFLANLEKYSKTYLYKFNWTLAAHR